MDVGEREKLRMDFSSERIGCSRERRGPLSPSPIIELKMDLYSRCPIKLVPYSIFGCPTIQVGIQCPFFST